MTDGISLEEARRLFGNKPEPGEGCIWCGDLECDYPKAHVVPRFEGQYNQTPYVEPPPDEPLPQPGEIWKSKKMHGVRRRKWRLVVRISKVENGAVHAICANTHSSGDPVVRPLKEFVENFFRRVPV